MILLFKKFLFLFLKGADGKVIPLSAPTLQKLVAVGAIKPGLQIATPEVGAIGSTSGKEGGEMTATAGEAGPGVVRVVRQVAVQGQQQVQSLVFNLYSTIPNPSF